MTTHEDAAGAVVGDYLESIVRRPEEDGRDFHLVLMHLHHDGVLAKGGRRVNGIAGDRRRRAFQAHRIVEPPE